MGARLYASGARRPKGAEQLEVAKGARLYARRARRTRGAAQLEAVEGERLYVSGAASKGQRGAEQLHAARWARGFT